MSNRKLLLIAALFFSSLTCPVFAADTDGTSESSPAQKEGPSDFEDWYKPEGAYQQDDQQQTTEDASDTNGGDDGSDLTQDEFVPSEAQ